MKNKKFWKIFKYVLGFISDFESILLGITIVYLTLIYTYNVAIDSSQIVVSSPQGMLMFASGIETSIWAFRLGTLIFAATNRVFSYFAKKGSVFNLIANVFYLQSNVLFLMAIGLNDSFAIFLIILSILYIVNSVFIIKGLIRKESKNVKLSKTSRT